MTGLLLLACLGGPAHAVQDPAGENTGTPSPDPGTEGWVGPDPIEPVSTGDLKVNLLMIRAGAVPSASTNSASLPDMLVTGSVAQEATSQPPGFLPGAVTANPWSIWSDFRGGSYDDNLAGADGAKGNFAQATLGLGLALTDGVTAGMTLSLEHIAEDERGTASNMNGNGFAIGPYLAMDLAGGISFEARAQWGWSSAEVEEDATVTVLQGTRETERMLVEARLSAEQDLGPVHLVPDVTFFLGRDHHGSYTLTDGVNAAEAASGTEVLGRASAGVRLSHDIALEAGTLSPFVSGRLSWDFQQPEESADAVRATLGAGLTYAATETVVSAAVEWDGVSAEGLETLVAKLSLAHAF